MADLANLLADGKPSVTVLINGGKVTWLDAWESVKAGRPVLVIAGTGRTADELAGAIRGAPLKEGLEGILPEEVSDEALGGRAKYLVASGLVSAVDLTDDDDALVAVIQRMLSGETKQHS